jgi:hypothetical protein
VIIHHIEEHSKTHDDSYDNLVILCLNDHAVTHSKWEIYQHPLPPELIRSKKKEWVKALSDFKAGRRPAPVDEQYPGKPQLELSTNIDFSPPTPSEEAAGWKRSWFIKLRVENKGQAAAKSCFGRLLKITDEQGKQLTGLDALDLYWTRQDSPESYKKLDIQGNGDFTYLDIAQVKEAEDVLTLRVVVPRGHRLVVPPGHTQRSENLPPGIYYVSFGIYADNISLKPTWYKIKWEADYSVYLPCSIVKEVPPFGT